MNAYKIYQPGNQTTRLYEFQLRGNSFPTTSSWMMICSGVEQKTTDPKGCGKSVCQQLEPHMSYLYSLVDHVPTSCQFDVIKIQFLIISSINITISFWVSKCTLTEYLQTYLIRYSFYFLRHMLSIAVIIFSLLPQNSQIPPAIS